MAAVRRSSRALLLAIAVLALLAQFAGGHASASASALSCSAAEAGPRYESVQDLLVSIRATKHAKLLERHGVELADVAGMDEARWREIGLPMGPRSRILRAGARLRLCETQAWATKRKKTGRICLRGSQSPGQRKEAGI